MLKEIWLCFDSKNEYWYESKPNQFIVEKRNGERIGTNLIAILNNADKIVDTIKHTIHKIINTGDIEKEIFFSFNDIKHISIFLELSLSEECFNKYYCNSEYYLREKLIAKLKQSNDSTRKKDIEDELQKFDRKEIQKKRKVTTYVKFLNQIINNIFSFKHFFEITQKITGFDTNFENNFAKINLNEINEDKRKYLLELFNFMHNISIPESVVTYGKVLGNQLSLYDSNKLILTEGIAKTSFIEELYSAIKNNQIIRIHRFKINSIRDFLNISLYMLMSQNIVINKCQNCGKYFFVKSKTNEKYCSNVFRNGKTCSELSYEIKLSKDEIAKLCRKACKKSAVYKSRYYESRPKSKLLHEKFLKNIKIQRHLCENNTISLEDFAEWINENNWWKKK